MLHWLYVEKTTGNVIEAVPDDGRHQPGTVDRVHPAWAVVKADINPIQRMEVQLQRFKTDVSRLTPTGVGNSHTGSVDLTERPGWAVARMQKFLSRVGEKGGRQNELLAQIARDWIEKEGGPLPPPVL